MPAGYQSAVLPRGITVVARAELLETVRAAMGAGTLFAFAQHQPAARPLTGRGVVYAVALPDGTRVVVRHNRHGGFLAPITGDRFLAPTRAPLELAASLRLMSAGVRTPVVAAYVRYPAGGRFERADVATIEVVDGRDLGAVLVHDDLAAQKEALDAAATAMGALSAIGARHHDLNVKNLLITRSGGAMHAYVLDLDRITFGRAGDPSVVERNLERFARSARKWRERYGARVADDDLARVASLARAAASTRS